MRFRTALLIALLAPFDGVAAATSTPPPAQGLDCDAAKALPADADNDSKRRACTIPPKYQRDVGMAEIIGRAIRLHDLAAWVSTDALQAAHAFDHAPKGATSRGWVTRDLGDAILVKYIRRIDDRDQAFASARLRLSPWGVEQARSLDPPQPLDGVDDALIRARALALQQDDIFTCTKGAPNVVAFNFEEDGVPQILVFVMSAWTGDAPLGGYFMFRINSDATRVVDRFAQTRGCVVTPKADFGKSEALMVTHLTSATPTMFHVFMSLQYKKPVFVGTAQNKILWKIDDGRVSIVDAGDASQTATDAAQTP